MRFWVCCCLAWQLLCRWLSLTLFGGLSREKEMMFAPRYTVFHCGYLKGEQEMSEYADGFDDGKGEKFDELMEEIAALREHIARMGKSITPAVFIVEQNKILHEQNAALREQLVQALAIARKYEPDEKTSYVKYASDEIAELLKEEGK